MEVNDTMERFIEMLYDKIEKEAKIKSQGDTK